MKTTVETTRIIVVPLAILVLWLQAIPECQAQSPYIPPAYSVTITPQTNAETVSVTVSVDLPDTCHSVGNWGQPLRFGNTVYVDAQFWVAPLICLPVIMSVSTQYNLGTLPPGNYNFVFQAWGMTVKTQPFSVPVRLSIRAPQADSQVQLCWNTATSAWYRVECCSTLGTNEWTALTAWLPGNGNRFCTNDAVFVGQPQRFFRIAGTNAPPPP